MTPGDDGELGPACQPLGARRRRACATARGERRHHRLLGRRRPPRESAIRSLRSSASGRRGASFTRCPKSRGRRLRWSSAIASPARTATSQSSICGRWTTSRASSTGLRPSADDNLDRALCARRGAPAAAPPSLTTGEARALAGVRRSHVRSHPGSRRSGDGAAATRDGVGALLVDPSPSRIGHRSGLIGAIVFVVRDGPTASAA